MEQNVFSTGHEGSLKDQYQSYLQRVKAGDMGSLPALGALLTLVILFSATSTSFLTPLNFANLFVQSAELMMLAAALVFVLLLGEIDLSAGVTAGVGMAIFYTLFHGGMSWPLALLAGFGFGALVGLIVGFFVAKIGVPSFVVTLGFFLGFQGLQLVLLGAGGQFRIDVQPIEAIMTKNLPRIGGWIFLAICLIISILITLADRRRRAKHGLANKPMAIPLLRISLIGLVGAISIVILNGNRSVSVIPIFGTPIVIPVVVFVLGAGTLLLDRTKFGRHLYAVGGNAEAARRAGIKVTRIKITAFMISSTLAVFSGLLHVSRLGGVEATAGRQIVLSGVAAAVVGGVSLFGGKGRLAQAAIGAMVIAVIDNGLGLLEFPAGVNFLVAGGVLTLAATVDALSRKRTGGVLRV
jgi:D-xylose transport system permease protein